MDQPLTTGGWWANAWTNREGGCAFARVPVAAGPARRSPGLQIRTLLYDVSIRTSEHAQTEQYDICLKVVTLLLVFVFRPNLDLQARSNTALVGTREGGELRLFGGCDLSVDPVRTFGDLWRFDPRDGWQAASAGLSSLSFILPDSKLPLKLFGIRPLSSFRFETMGRTPNCKRRLFTEAFVPKR